MSTNCDHDWCYDSETETTVTHKCSKCKTTYTRNKRNTLFAVLMLAMVVACTLAMMWAGAPAA